jgi:hypothetical protein
MRNRLLLSIVTIIAGAILVACGGGGGSSAGGGGSSATRLSGAAKTVQATSYLNFKNVGLTPTNTPVTADARGYGDFSKSGNLDLFTAQLTYNVSLPIGQATPSIFKFWKVMSDGSYVEDTAKLSSNSGCIHPRKALVADFNGDLIPDIFVACHGYDGGAYPGEKSKLVLSQSNGTFLIQDALDVGYWHGATAFDVDGNGTIDLMLVNNNDAVRGNTYLNDGRGNFTKDTVNRFPASIASKGYYSIEAIDVNADGRQDLVLGGLEYDNSPTLVLINPGNTNFSAVSSSTLPKDSTFGIVLDFTVTNAGLNPILWSIRTQQSPFYTGYALNRIDLTALSGSTVKSSTGGNWLRWAIPTVINGAKYIASDNANDNFSYAY